MTHSFRKLPLLFTSIFVGACGLPGALGEAPTVTGQIEEWSGGAGYQIVVVPFGPYGNPTLSNGTIDTSGNLHLQLPSSAALMPYLGKPPGVDAHCATQPAADPPDLQVASVGLIAQRDGADQLYLTLANSLPSAVPKAGDLSADFLYADRDGTLVGTLDCSNQDSSTTTRYEIHFAKGWNTVIWKIDEWSRTPTTERTAQSGHTDNLPSDVKWYLSK